MADTKTFNKHFYKGTFDPFWDEPRVLPGGFAPDSGQTLPARGWVRRGELAEVDFSTLTCKLLKLTPVIEMESDTVARVPKGHLLAAGDAVTDGTESVTVSSIDTSDSGYDAVTLSAAVTGDSLYLQDVAPNAVVCADRQLDGFGGVAFACAYEGCVLYKALPAIPDGAAWKSGIYLAGNPRITFITQ